MEPSFYSVLWLDTDCHSPVSTQACARCPKQQVLYRRLSSPSSSETKSSAKGDALKPAAQYDTTTSYSALRAEPCSKPAADVHDEGLKCRK